MIGDFLCLSKERKHRDTIERTLVAHAAGEDDCPRGGGYGQGQEEKLTEGEALVAAHALRNGHGQVQAMHRYADEGEGGVAGRGARSAGLKPLSSLTIVRKQKLYSHKTRSLRTIGRKIKGPLWGTDVMVMVAEPRARDQLAMWADRIEEAMHEAKLVDGYKMQVTLDGGEEIFMDT